MMAVCALAVGALAMGCSDKCKSFCQDGQKCSAGENNAIPSATDCGKLCDDLDSVASAATCDDEKNAYLDCESGVKDVCTDTSCEDKSTAFGTCIGTYCSAHNTDSSCTKFYADLGITQ
ncbi:MAG TPA: hypothetical protein VMI54_00515 [Polyangiaceae bacterium]|nr:hypothetical protein [Polyangiaceae bacterium]